MFADLLDLNHPLFWTVDGLLDDKTCRELMTRIDESNPELATINRPTGARVDTGTRNNDRVILDDPDLAAALFQLVEAHVPASMKGMQAIGANERLRCYRYSPGQRFRPHYDGAFHRNDDEQSLLTYMIYLNEGFDGGETVFLDFEKTVVPKRGMALLFQHHVLHEAREVTSGTKYAIRTDVMYRRQ